MIHITTQELHVHSPFLKNPVHSKVDKFGDPLLKRIKVHVLLLSLLVTLKNVKLQCLTPYSNRECFSLVQNIKKILL